MRTSISERSLAEELKHHAGATLAQTPAIHCSRSGADWRERGVIKANTGGLQQRRNFIAFTAGMPIP